MFARIAALMLAGFASAAVAQADIDLGAYAATDHPAQDYVAAAETFNAGDRLKGGCLFYIGQYRYRVYIMARPNLDPTGDPAVFSALSEQVGRPINQWLGGDLADWLAAMDCAIGWVETHDDPLTPKRRNAGAHDEVLAGLRELRADVAAMDPARLRADRRASGLPNR